MSLTSVIPCLVSLHVTDRRSGCINSDAHTTERRGNNKKQAFTFKANSIREILSGPRGTQSRSLAALAVSRALSLNDIQFTRQAAKREAKEATRTPTTPIMYGDGFSISNATLYTILIHPLYIIFSIQ